MGCYSGPCEAMTIPSALHGRSTVRRFPCREDNFNEEVQAVIEFESNGTGHFQFGYVQGYMDWRSTTRDDELPGQGAIAAKWNLGGTPTLYILDPKGVIRYKWVSSPSAKAIDAALDKLIKEAEAGADLAVPLNDLADQVRMGDIFLQLVGDASGRGDQLP